MINMYNYRNFINQLNISSNATLLEHLKYSPRNTFLEAEFVFLCSTQLVRNLLSELMTVHIDKKLGVINMTDECRDRIIEINTIISQLLINQVEEVNRLKYLHSINQIGDIEYVNRLLSELHRATDSITLMSSNLNQTEDEIRSIAKQHLQKQGRIIIDLFRTIKGR